MPLEIIPENRPLAPEKHKCNLPITHTWRSSETPDRPEGSIFICDCDQAWFVTKTKDMTYTGYRLLWLKVRWWNFKLKARIKEYNALPQV